MDPSRLETQLSEHDLARLLALRGDEDVVDLGSGAGFYTDRIAALTTGTVYALDIQPEMHEFYRSRGRARERPPGRTATSPIWTFRPPAWMWPAPSPSGTRRAG